MYIRDRLDNLACSKLLGNILVAAPYADIGNAFTKSVICILAHDENGTLGVVVNKYIKGLDPEFIYNALEIPINTNIKDDKKILFGGPSEVEKGLIIHSEDYQKNNLISLHTGLQVSSNMDILQDIAHGNGPKHYQIILGYAGWAPGQLEEEIKNNDWLVLPFSKSLVLENSHPNKWEVAINSIGASSACFTSTFGNA